MHGQLHYVVGRKYTYEVRGSAERSRVCSAFRWTRTRPAGEDSSRVVLLGQHCGDT
jgi:hypothetical protein